MAEISLSSFERRHIGISAEEQAEMLAAVGASSMENLISETIPSSIRMESDLKIPSALTEQEYLDFLKQKASKNKVYNNFIGQGYYGTITPSVILRNVFHNPGWYTQYTPYQAEIAQGRLEALLNFQTMVSDLTGLPIANGSLLDESTAAAEAMAMFQSIRNKKRKKDPATLFFVDQHVYAQTIDVIKTRAQPIGVEVIVGDYKSYEITDNLIGAVVQYPDSVGSVEDYGAFCDACHETGALVCAAADIMSLALLKPPGEWGADAVVGNTQRMGVPMGYGGPHAAYFSTKEDYKRLIPGRIIGVSLDAQKDQALRMALQTREQHIKRERATSNICTAQALLAIMASMYTVYHGPSGIRDIADDIHHKAYILYNNLKTIGYEIVNDTFFDTITIKMDAGDIGKVKYLAGEDFINLFYREESISISVDETTTDAQLQLLITVMAEIKELNYTISSSNGVVAIPQSMIRTSAYLQHPVFHSHQTETKMMRYIKHLENKDLSLTHSMIALGSCTMKLNAATQLIPVSWPAFSAIHPFAPESQVVGYREIFEELEDMLAEITGFTACSLQPNSGAQGEYAGLMVIAAYHRDRQEGHRNIALIPSSAHGTNPASAVMAGMKVVVIKCDEKGNIDIHDLKDKAALHAENLASLMVTYPSTHGVFETAIKEICETIHNHGGLVYMDGANMNAQVGLTSPGIIGADVCHLNLHKTFAIPHGGGGPGMGPICVNDKLAPYLPSHAVTPTGGEKAISAVSSAGWGSASILLISYAYILLLGKEGLRRSTEAAILNANYMKALLEKDYPILYSGENGRAAHEMIIDLRQFKPLNITAEDIAKRLIDYGFHAPTLSFPVPGTIMIEPTESESKDELDRFCDALISIKSEIDAIASGKVGEENNVLKNAPHSLKVLTQDEWEFPYTRQEAAYPLPYLHQRKFWASVGRVDNAHGDRNLICTCPPIEDYEEEINP